MDAPENTLEEQYLAETSARDLEVPELNVTPHHPAEITLVELQAAVLEEEPDMDQTTFNAMLRTALAGFTATDGAGVAIQTPGGDFQVSSEAAYVVTAASVQIVATEGGVSIGGSSVAIDGLPTDDPEEVGQLWLDGDTVKVSAG